MLARAIIVPLLLTAATALPAAGAAPDGDEPQCDATALIVCADLDLQAAVSCQGAGARVECAVSFGWTAESFSPLGLGGDAWREVAITIAPCVEEPCLVMTTFDLGYCAWDPTERCDEERATSAAYAFDLEPGQCAQVDVELEGYVLAAVPAEGPPLARVLHSATPVEASSAACHSE